MLSSESQQTSGLKYEKHVFKKNCGNVRRSTLSLNGNTGFDVYVGKLFLKLLF